MTSLKFLSSSLHQSQKSLLKRNSFCVSSSSLSNIIPNNRSQHIGTFSHNNTIYSPLHPHRFYSTESTAEQQESTQQEPEKPRHWHINETDYGTIEITMNSNSVNCLNWQFFKDFHNTVEILKKDYPPHKPLVLRSSSSKVFSAGLDLPFVTTITDENEALDFVDALNRCFTKMYLLKRPTIAVLEDKHAIAGGLIMALCADFQIVCTENNKAMYGLKEIALGVPFPSQTYYIIEKEISDRNLFKEMTMTGYWIPADEGVRRGLFSHGVKSTDEIEGKIKEIVSRFDQEKSRDAYLQLKRMMKSNPFRAWLEDDPDTVQSHDTEFVRCLLKESTRDLMLAAVNQGSGNKKEQKESGNNCATPENAEHA